MGEGLVGARGRAGSTVLAGSGAALLARLWPRQTLQRTNHFGFPLSFLARTVVLLTAWQLFQMSPGTPSPHILAQKQNTDGVSKYCQMRAIDLGRKSTTNGLNSTLLHQGRPPSALFPSPSAPTQASPALLPASPSARRVLEAPSAGDCT